MQIMDANPTQTQSQTRKKGAPLKGKSRRATRTFNIEQGLLDRISIVTQELNSTGERVSMNDVVNTALKVVFGQDDTPKS